MIRLVEREEGKNNVTSQNVLRSFRFLRDDDDMVTGHGSSLKREVISKRLDIRVLWNLINNKSIEVLTN